MLCKWKDERGLTLVELLAALVILTIFIVPFTSIGTTAFSYFKEDKDLNQAVLVAEQAMDSLKSEIESTGTTTTLHGTLNTYYWEADPLTTYEDRPHLHEVTVHVYKDDTKAHEITHLTTVMRRKGA